MPDGCAYLNDNGNALPPTLQPNVPTGSIQFGGRPDWKPRLRFFNFDTIKVVANTDGATLAAAAAAASNSSAYPSAFAIASFSFNVPVGVFLFSFVGSITSVAAGNAGLFCSKNSAPGISLTNGNAPFSICDIITQPNSVAGVPSPVVRNLQLALNDGTGMRFDPGDNLTIYGSGPNDAGTLLTGILTAYYIALTT